MKFNDMATKLNSYHLPRVFYKGEPVPDTLEKVYCQNPDVCTHCLVFGCTVIAYQKHNQPIIKALCPDPTATVLNFKSTPNIMHIIKGIPTTIIYEEQK